MNDEIEDTIEDLFDYTGSHLDDLFPEDLESPRNLSWCIRTDIAKDRLNKMSIYEISKISEEEILRVFHYKHRPKQMYWSRCLSMVAEEKRRKISDLQKFMKDFRD